MKQPVINPTVLEIVKRIGALNIDEFPTARAARLAVELLEEVNRVRDSQKETTT